MVSKVNGLDLSTCTITDLDLLLKNEIYRDVDSEFGKEIVQELESRLKVA